jgi:hypothetical protein
VVEIQKPTSDDVLYGEAGTIPPKWHEWAVQHGKPDERDAANLVTAGAPGAEWVEYPEGHKLHGSHYGEVRFPGERPNVSGMILVRLADLEFQKTP